MAVGYICDMCGKLIRSRFSYIKIFKNGVSAYTECELCEKCYDRLVNDIFKAGENRLLEELNGITDEV